MPGISSLVRALQAWRSDRRLRHDGGHAPRRPRSRPRAPCGRPSATGAPHSGRSRAPVSMPRSTRDEMPCITTSRSAVRRRCRRARPAAVRRSRHTIRRRAARRLNRPVAGSMIGPPASRGDVMIVAARPNRRCRSRQPRRRSAPRASRARDARRSPPASAAPGRSARPTGRSAGLGPSRRRSASPIASAWAKPARVSGVCDGRRPASARRR